MTSSRLQRGLFQRGHKHDECHLFTISLPVPALWFLSPADQLSPGGGVVRTQYEACPAVHAPAHRGSERREPLQAFVELLSPPSCASLPLPPTASSTPLPGVQPEFQTGLRGPGSHSALGFLAAAPPPGQLGCRALHDHQGPGWLWASPITSLGFRFLSL